MKIGYAMYSARDLVKDPASMRATLQALAGMGYEGVEFFLYAGTPAGELRAMLDETGLAAIATHIHKPRWEADTDGEIEYAAKAGIPALVYPWVDPADRTDAFYAALPAELERLAGLCGEKGIRLLYHNHDFEFAPYGEGRVIDHLLNASEAYGYEMDAFWAQFAGVDAPAFLRQLGSRVPMIHVKDYTGADETGWPKITAIGQGKMDNAPIIRAARDLGKEWLIVELDDSPWPPLESARMSIEYIKRVLDGAGA